MAASADSAHQLAAAIAGLGHGSSDEDDEVLEGYDSDEDPGLQERVLGSLPDQVAQIDVADIVDQLGERSMATRIQAARKLAAFLRAGPPASSLSSQWVLDATATFSSVVCCFYDGSLVLVLTCSV